MAVEGVSTRWLGILVAGLAAGGAIVYTDNFAFGGEVSPIVVVALLLAATGGFGVVWGRRAWLAALATWICVPGAHLVKHLFGLPETLHPDTWASILYLALFSLAVAAAGVAVGTGIHGATTTSARRSG